MAALAILVFHAGPLYGITSPAEGQLAVDLFFVMSGFIIAFRYDRDFSRGLGLGAFFRIRLIRLYPLFLLGLVLGMVSPLIAIMLGQAGALRNPFLETFGLGLFMLPSPLVQAKIQTVYPLNYAAWSLALEILVNIAYAATFRVWTVRRLLGLIAVAFAGLCICAAHYGTLNIGYYWDNAPGGVARILFSFPMGVLLFRLYDRGIVMAGAPWWALLGASIGLFVFDAPVGKPVWELFAVAIVIPLIVAASLTRDPPRAMQPACAMAGVMSYVLYSLHAPFISFFERVETHMHIPAFGPGMLRPLVFSLALVTLCVIAHAAYDRPIRRWLTGAFGQAKVSRGALDTKLTLLA